MSISMIESQTRSHEHELEIEASVQEVWKAITDAAELVNWFPLEAVVDPGAEGVITYSWGDELRNSCRVESWEKGAHLRTTWMGTEDQPSPLFVDWHLEGERGRTKLRLVHSGFGSGPEWDEEYEGTRLGWSYELQSLKHYLERHLGKRRTAFWIQQPVELQPSEVWSRLTAPDGLIRSGGVDSLQVGSKVDLQLASGDRVQGPALLLAPPREMAFAAENLGDGLIRFGYEACGSGPSAMIWLSLWDAKDEVAAGLRDRLQAALQQTFA